MKKSEYWPRALKIKYGEWKNTEEREREGPSAVSALGLFHFFQSILLLSDSSKCRESCWLRVPRDWLVPLRSAQIFLSYPIYFFKCQQAQPYELKSNI